MASLIQFTLIHKLLIDQGGEAPQLGAMSTPCTMPMSHTNFCTQHFEWLAVVSHDGRQSYNYSVDRDIDGDDGHSTWSSASFQES